MTVAVDTNIVLDIVSDDPVHGQQSLAKLRRSLEEENAILSEVVWAELSPALARYGGVAPILDGLKISFASSGDEALDVAGAAFQSYLANRQTSRCPNCGTVIPGRSRILPDFMIGAHALIHAGRLLTRDRGYYATYFPDLVLV